MEAAFRTAGLILAPRAVMVMVMVGAFVLALFSMFRGWLGLATLVAYCLLTIIPLALIEWSKTK